MDFTDLFKQPEIVRNIFSSFILLFFLIITRLIAVRYLAKSARHVPGTKRSWLVHINNLFTMLMILGLVIVWASKLQSFALSIVALAAAIVIATKELILCLLGGIYKSIVRPFRIGDRIEINGYRGEVIDHNFLSTEVLEIGTLMSQYTGKSVEIPNSVLLSHPVTKEDKSHRYRLHTFSVAQPIEIDIEKHKRLLEESAFIVCKDYLADAKRFMEDIQRKEGIEAPSVDPRVSISLSHHDSVEYTVRIPAPALRGFRVEQEVLMHYVKKRKQALIEEPLVRTRTDV